MSVWDAVRRNNSPLLNTAYEVGKADKFGDLAQRISAISEKEELKVKIANVNNKFKMSVRLTTVL